MRSNSYSAREKNCCILCNAKTYSNVHQSSPLATILGLLNPAMSLFPPGRSVLILSFQLRLDQPSGLFAIGSPKNTLCIFSPVHATIRLSYPAFRVKVNQFVLARRCKYLPLVNITRLRRKPSLSAGLRLSQDNVQIILQKTTAFYTSLLSHHHDSLSL